MFALDLLAVRAPRCLSRVQPASSASRAPVLPVAQRPNASPCHKRDRRFAPQKPSVPLAHTIERASRFPSSPCALLPRSFARVQLSTPFFSCAPALFVKNAGGGVPRERSCLRSMSCALCKTPKTEEIVENLPANPATTAEPTAQPRMRDPRLCVIVFGRPHLAARRVSRILKTKSEVHLL
jgi:hypothetical protein